MQYTPHCQKIHHLLAQQACNSNGIGCCEKIIFDLSFFLQLKTEFIACLLTVCLPAVVAMFDSKYETPSDHIQS